MLTQDGGDNGENANEFWFLTRLLVIAFLVPVLPACRADDFEAVDLQRSAVGVTPTFVQRSSIVPQTSQTTVAVGYAAAQVAGDLNVVIVGWNDSTASVTSVVDSKGNLYQLAIGPTRLTGAHSQSIYYARNILAAAAAANSVTVGFSPAAAFPDVRILEYRGIDVSNPLDGAVGASGSTASSNSGTLTTTNPTDLLVAGNVVETLTSAAGTGFTSRVITAPDGDIAEDRVVTAVGTYSAAATLSPTGQWVMQMVAFRAAGSGPDVTPPGAPSNLTASAASASQINLTWTAATDDVAVTGYLIERCLGAGCAAFAALGTASGTSFSNSGLSAGTSYSYRVRATDGAGNLGAFTATASATTPSPDVQAPGAPTTLTATAASLSQINLAWPAATDNVGVTSYLIERCLSAGCADFAQIATTSATAFTSSALTAATTYSFRVRATDAAGNLGAYSPIATATTLAPDTQAPTAPATLGATANSSSQINLTWAAASDNVGVTSYAIERCQGAGCASFAAAGTSTTTSFSSTGLGAATSYSFRVRASDAAGNFGAYSPVASATTQAGTAATPAFVQGSSQTPQVAQTTVILPYAAAQRAGDLNVIIVGWNDTTAQVTSVADSAGNSYTLAAGPVLLAGTLSQSIYYAKNIVAAAAAANSVTVGFNQAAAFADVRILEYSGIDPTNPVDVTAAGQGTSATSATAAVTTTSSVDLLVAGNLVTTSTSAAGTGFTSRMITNPDGDIAEDRVVTAAGSYSASATLSSTGGWIMQLVAFRAAGAATLPADTTPPTASISAPVTGATLTGTVTVSVAASDAAGVASVQLVVDGTAVGAADSTSPYDIALNTTNLSNGAHTLTARALDTSGNLGNAPGIGITVSNQNGSAQSGLWSGTVPLPIVAINLALLPTGKMLMWDGQNDWGHNARVWDPATNATTSVPSPSNIFCTGQDVMSDGRIFVAGGHNGDAHLGLTAANIFDPVSGGWTVAAEMANPRWYPTVTALPDQRMLVMGGESTCNFCNVTVAEIYNATTNSWTKLTSAPLAFPYYPHVFVLPDGRVIVPATTREPIVSQILDLSALTWTAVGGAAVDGGSTVMYLPGKFLKTGTAVDPDQAVRNAAATAYVLDTTQTSPAPPPSWRAVAAMTATRTFHTMTSLPDGTVLVSGGGPTTAATNTAGAILPAEIWSPDTETFTRVASMNAPRLYHSTALLMPDGRVAVTGGGRFDNVNAPTDQFSAEFFSPPYLFKGTRPAITSAPATLQYGQSFGVQTPDAARIAKVSLIRFGAVTHSINMGQRFLPLSFSTVTGAVTVTAPANANLAPPGYYMLFLIDTNGVPSVAAVLRI
jgi:chitodextrinase